MAFSRILSFLLVLSTSVDLNRAFPSYNRWNSFLNDLRENDDSECKDERPDCGDIIKYVGTGAELDKYCIKYKNVHTVKMCRKTCRMCKAPGPIECKDERPDCDLIRNITRGGVAMKKYCTDWQEHTSVQQCRKTCDLCSKPPSPTEEPETEEPETEKPTLKPTMKITVAPQSTTKQPEILTGFQETCLDAHNGYRYFHGVPPLKWSTELSRDALIWANHLASSNKFDHDPTAQGKDQGENLYYIKPAMKVCDTDAEPGESCLSCQEIVKAWYEEEEDYDYTTGKGKRTYDVVLHFTQLIWKASTELGMATAVANNRLVAVARYKPRGNIQGEFQENVPPPDFP